MREKLKFRHNVHADEGFMHMNFGALSVLSFGASCHVTALLDVESRKKVDKFEPVPLYLNKYRY